MKPVLFVVFFTLGVSLMVFSGYLPQSATARTNGSDPDAGFSPGPITRISRPIAAPPVVVAPPAPVDEPSPLAHVSASGPLDSHPEPVPDEDDPGSGQPERMRRAGGEGGLSPDDGGEEALEAPAKERRGRHRPAERADVPEDEVPPEDAAAAGAPVEAGFEPPLADAGPDRVVWAGWDDIPLDGSASVGQQLVYRWRQTAGPVDTAIASETSAATSAGGLQHGDRPSWRPARFTFELTVVDAAGQQATDTVNYTVLAAPPLRIRPVPERRFELRDGYQLAVYAAWTTNVETYETTFEIVSDSELTLTRLGGGPFEVGGGREGRRWVYQVVLTPQGDEPTSWVEYLADTENQIPAVIQLGVTWDERAVGNGG